MRRTTILAIVLMVLIGGVSVAQDPGPLLGDKDTMLLTVFLKHDQFSTTCFRPKEWRSSITT